MKVVLYIFFVSTDTISNTMKLGRKKKLDHKVEIAFVLLFYFFNTSRFIG